MRTDGVMFCVAFTLLIVFGWLYGDARSDLSQERSRSTAMSEQIESQAHWIRTLQGRLNARRDDLGMEPIEFSRY